MHCLVEVARRKQERSEVFTVNDRQGLRRKRTPLKVNRRAKIAIAGHPPRCGRKYQRILGVSAQRRGVRPFGCLHVLDFVVVVRQPHPGRSIVRVQTDRLLGSSFQLLEVVVLLRPLTMKNSIHTREPGPCSG